MGLRLRRGDIVWARVVFPKKWWPGLVRSIGGHRVAVSFFNDGEDSRVFLETEVFFFEENFESLSKTLQNCSRGQELLDSALKLLARRAAYSLKCPCHFRPSPTGGKNSRQSRRRRDVFRPDELLSLVHGLAVSPFVGVGDSDFVSTVTMASQLHVFRRYLVAERKVLLDPKATKERLQNSPLPIAGACSVAQSSDISNLGFDSLNVDQPNSGKASVETRYCLPSFARSDNYNIRVETNRLQSSNAAFGFRESSTENKLHLPVVASDALSSMPQATQQSSHTIQMDHSISFDKHKISVENGRQDGINAPISSRESSMLDAASSMPQEAQQSENAIQMDHSRDDHNISVENDRQDCINAAFSSMLKLLLPLVTSYAPLSMPRESQQSENAIHMDHSRDNHNISVESGRQDGINAAFSSRESSTEKLLLPRVTSDAPSSMPREAQQSENAIHMDHSRDNYNISVVTRKRESTNTAFSFKERSTEKKRRVDEQSARTMYGSCQFLCMKFPRDFSPPSKKDLVRKFRRFGQIDIVRTKVSERLGSAQVVFLHPFDALVAYRYAKENKGLFGGSTVLFWLDPREKKRNQSKFVAPMPILKSCLKSPHSGGQEDKKRSRKVRFLMQS